MSISYNGLWKLLIDKNMKKVDLMNRVEISSSTVAKMTKGEYWAKTHGQDELDKVNEKIRAAGLKPASTVSRT